MNIAIRNLFYIIALLSIAVCARSETVYVTDELRAGLHQDRDLESPIVKILATGAQLEVIRREKNLSYVKDPDGARGWIDNSYLKDEITTIAQLKSEVNKNQDLEKQISQLRKELDSLKSDNTTQKAQTYTALEEEHKKLLKQYQTEQNRVKALQDQLKKMNERTGQSGADTPPLQQLEQLQQEKQRLETQLASLMDKKMGINSVHPGTQAADNNSGIGSRGTSRFFYYTLTIILGFALGIFFMDYLNKRRHGGFRV